MAMTPADYDAWYETARGRWIGTREFVLLGHLLEARPGETLLDVGCGTGYFTRRFARETGLMVTGIDIAPAMLNFARDKASDIPFACADATCLPFADRAFDHVVAVTSLCFVTEEGPMLREMARIARRRVALGLLNRHSLLYWQKGGGKNRGYAGARWHAWAEAHTLLSSASIGKIRSASALFLPSGGAVAQAIEQRLPSSLPFGGFLAIAGEPQSSCWRGSQEN